MFNTARNELEPVFCSFARSGPLSTLSPKRPSQARDELDDDDDRDPDLAPIVNGACTGCGWDADDCTCLLDAGSA